MLPRFLHAEEPGSAAHLLKRFWWIKLCHGPEVVFADQCWTFYLTSYSAPCVDWKEDDKWVEYIVVYCSSSKKVWFGLATADDENGTCTKILYTMPNVASLHENYVVGNYIQLDPSFSDNGNGSIGDQPCITASCPANQIKLQTIMLGQFNRNESMPVRPDALINTHYWIIPRSTNYQQAPVSSYIDKRGVGVFNRSATSSSSPSSKSRKGLHHQQQEQQQTSAHRTCNHLIVPFWTLSLCLDSSSMEVYLESTTPVNTKASLGSCTRCEFLNKIQPDDQSSSVIISAPAVAWLRGWH